MQTFLPFPDITQSLMCLDNRRLGKQRVEAYQILHTLWGISSGWKNHPAVQMWKGSEKLLARYYNTSLHIWESRGFQNIKLTPIHMTSFIWSDTDENPWWFGNPKFHLSHQSNLIRKLPLHYRPLFPEGIPNDIPYWWPTEHLEEKI